MKIVCTLIILWKIPNGTICFALLEALAILTPLNQSVKEKSQFLTNKHFNALKSNSEVPIIEKGMLCLPYLVNIKREKLGCIAKT